MTSPLRFIIFGIQRTGTIFLTQMLDSHPQILCIGEAFQDVDTPCHHKFKIQRYRTYVADSFFRKLKNRLMKHRSIKSYLNKVFSSNSFKAIGFKLMLNQLELHPELINYLRSYNFKVVHIVRNNILKTHISRIRATQTGIYVSRNSQRQDRVTIPLETLYNNLDNLKKQNRQLRVYLDRLGLDSFTVVYEDLQQQRECVLKIVMDFLHVDSSIVLSPETKKIISDDLNHVIQNFDEVNSLLKGSEYMELLN